MASTEGPDGGEKAAELFVRALEAEGVTHVFGVPGEENLDLLEALAHSPIKVVVTRHEQAAGFMAATHGRLTGEPGVALATLGPGATNLVTAAAYATLGGMPLVLVTGQKPIRSSKQARFQIVDVVATMEPHTKATRRIEGPDFVTACVREAFRLARLERPGAVHLELPEDVAAGTSELGPLPRATSRRPIADDEALARAAERIDAAERPLLVLGSGANRTRTCAALRALVDDRRLPFVSTQMGKGVVSEDHPLWLGTAALSSGDFEHRAFEVADLIVNVGHDVVEKPPFRMRPGGTEVLHVSYTSAEVDPLYFPGTELRGDIATNVAALNARIRTREACADFEVVRRALRDHVARDANLGGERLRTERVVADVRRVLPREGIVALDNGIYKLWFARNYPAYEPNTVLLDNALATMGAGLPSAMMAAHLFPDRPVVAVTGDGGHLMNSAELETAVRMQLDLVVVVLRDDALGMIKWKQEELGFADYGLDLGNPDLVAHTASFGATGTRVERADAFAPALEAALAAGGVHVLDVPVDYSQNHFILHEEVQALSAALELEHGD